MPRFSRKSKRRTGDNQDPVAHLLTGYCLHCIINQVDHDGDALKPQWERLRDTLLPAFVREHPGERPWAWWQWDAPGRRERIDGKPHPFDDKGRTLHVANTDSKTFWQVAYKLSWGYPACHIPPFDNDVRAASFEATWEYLVRHNLLLPEDSP